MVVSGNGYGSFGTNCLCMLQIHLLSGKRLGGVAMKKLFDNKKAKHFSPAKFIWPVFRFILLLGLCYVIISPFLQKISAMFMSPSDLQNPTVWMIPLDPTFDNVVRVLKYGDYIPAFINSLLISLICATLQTFICCMVGYGFAKFKFKGKTLFFLLAVFTIIIPPF